MTISNDHLSGFVIGAGAAAAAYYYYRKNQPQVDEFLRKQGIELPSLQVERDLGDWSIEDLVREKERLEDLISEREYSDQQSPPSDRPAEPQPASAPEMA
ncbi:hypothetical protein BMS3Bbin04_01044 [bacterium BMS3Bbin04]|nr:hypothetical protein BMS3Bbin04_01044 [bacterium BMS3Bbin04]